VKKLIVAALTFVLGLFTVTTGASAHGRGGPKPTIVFVHGAFADASGFADSIASLQRLGYPVVAPANPLRGLTGDAEYVKSALAQITGPIILVGHSYGGAVITNAAYGNPNVKALVYVAAYALDEGESLAAAGDLGGGHSDLLANVEFRDYPGAPAIPGTPAGHDQDAYIKQASFRAVFAADVPAAKAAVMAATQRPLSLLGLLTPSGPPAWKTIPSWYLVARNDKAIPPEAERTMAARAHAHTVEIASSHAVMVSHPKAVTTLVLAAAASVH
jgi:pimeloyl-ACP methyl ester carboxylesterase